MEGSTLTKTTIKKSDTPSIAALRHDYVRFLRTFSTDLPATDPNYIMAYEERKFCQDSGIALDDEYAYRMWLVSRLLHYEQSLVEEDVRLQELRQAEREARRVYYQCQVELKQVPFWRHFIQAPPIVGQARAANTAWQSARDAVEAAQQHRKFLQQELWEVLEIAYSPHWLQRERRRESKSPKPGSAEYRQMMEDFYRRFFGENHSNVAVQWAMNVYADLRQAERYKDA